MVFFRVVKGHYGVRHVGWVAGYSREEAGQTHRRVGRGGYRGGVGGGRQADEGGEEGEELLRGVGGQEADGVIVWEELEDVEECRPFGRTGGGCCHPFGHPGGGRWWRQRGEHAEWRWRRWWWWRGGWGRWWWWWW